MMRWQDWSMVAVPAFVLTNIVSFIVGYGSGAGAPPDPRLEVIHVLRLEAATTCKNHKDIIEEANTLLRDNIDGLITPEGMRKVVNDVVDRC